jgi:hypothetical protein
MKNPPAFPRPISNDSATPEGITQGDRIEYSQSQDGMTLRDYFAAKAMVGFLTNKEWVDKTTPVISKCAFAMADAMLESREKP